MKLRLPLILLAFINQIALSSTVPWQEAPAVYDTAGGLVEVVLTENKSMDYDSVPQTENAISISGGGTFLFNGGGYDFSLSGESASWDYGITRKGVMADSGLTFDKFGDMEFSYGNVVLADNIYDTPPTIENPADAELSSSMIYASGDIMFSNIAGTLSFAHNFLNLTKDKYLREITARASAIYSGGNLSFENIGGTFTMRDNHLDINYNLGFEGVVASGLVAMSVQGGGIHAAEDVQFSGLKSGMMMEMQMVNLAGNFELEQNKLDINMGAFGAGIYAGGKVHVEDVLGGVEINNSILYGNMFISADGEGLDISEEVDISAKFVLKGSAVYAGEGIVFSNIDNISAKYNTIRMNLNADIRPSIDLSAGESMNIEFSADIMGGAFSSSGDIIFRQIDQGIVLESNNVFSSFLIGAGNDLPHVLSIKGEYLITGGAICAEGAVVIEDVSGDVELKMNNISYNSSSSNYNSMMAFDYTAGSNHVTNIEYDFKVGGSGIYAQKGVLLRNITGDVEISDNGIYNYSYVMASEDSRFNINSNNVGGGAGIYSEGEIVFQNIQGTISLLRNITSVSDTIGVYDKGNLQIKSSYQFSGEAIRGEKSVVFLNLEGDVQISENSMSVQFWSALMPEDHSGIEIISHGAIYAGENIVFSEMEGDLSFARNQLLVNASCNAVLMGAAGHAEKVLIMDNITGDIRVEENELISDYQYSGMGVINMPVQRMATGGGFSSLGGMLFSRITGNVHFESNRVSSYNYPQNSRNSEILSGGALYSEGVIDWGSIQGDVSFVGNSVFGGHFVDNMGGATINARGGAVAGLGGVTVSENITGDMIYRNNMVQVAMMSSASLNLNYGYGEGGALYLGGDSVIQKVKGIILFENNYVMGQGEKESARIEAAGGAISLAEGGRLVLRADEGDVLFRDNAVGMMSDSLIPVLSYGGAIYVNGGDRPGSPDLLSLEAGAGRVVAFTGNIHKGTLVPEGIGYIVQEGTGEANAIYMNRNATLQLAGAGSIFFDDPIMSGEEGGVALLKTGSGTAYFVTEENVINGKGLGENAIRVEGGFLHASSGGQLELAGSDALFNVAAGGTLSGSGVFISEGGFVISGALSPDNIEYSLDVSGGNPVVLSSQMRMRAAGGGVSVGTLHLQGNVKGAGGRVISEVDMVSGLGDNVIVDGDFSGKLTWKGVHTGDDDKADLNKKVVVLEVLGDVQAGASVTGSMAVGIYKVGLEHGSNPNGAGTAWWTVYKEEYVPEVEVALNTAGSLAGSWFRQLDNLNKRMGELRFSPESSSQGNIWVRSYGLQADVDMKIKGIHGMKEYHYGADMGTDYLLLNNKEGHRLYAGIFAGYQRVDRQFHDEDRSKGNTDSVLGGGYLTWIKDSGWYADLIVKGQSFDNSGEVQGNEPGKFGYNNWGLGASLEGGKNFALDEHWFIEPMAQVSWLRLSGDDYLSASGMEVQAKSSNAWLFSGMVRVGRTDYAGSSGEHIFQTYIKAGISEQVSNGGAVYIEGHGWRPNVDGTQGLGGVGVIWQYGRHQVHLDYEAGIGDKVDMPWNVNLGYRYQF